MKEKRFVVVQTCDGYDAWFSGMFDSYGGAVWSRNINQAAHYIEASAIHIAQSLNARIWEVKE